MNSNNSGAQPSSSEREMSDMRVLAQATLRLVTHVSLVD
jgi:hypothetical protein